MQRRAFLRSLLVGATGAAAAAALPDVERLLWTPGDRTHFLPPAGGWSGVDYGHYEGSAFLQPGDIFTIDGVYAVNPITGKQAQFLQSFIAREVSPDGWTFDPATYVWSKGDRHITDELRVRSGVPLDEIAGNVARWPLRPVFDLPKMAEQYRRGMSEPITTEWLVDTRVAMDPNYVARITG